MTAFPQGRRAPAAFPALLLLAAAGCASDHPSAPGPRATADRLGSALGATIESPARDGTVTNDSLARVVAALARDRATYASTLAAVKRAFTGGEAAPRLIQLPLDRAPQ